MKRLRLSKALTIPDGTTVADACRRMATRRVDAALLTDSSALLCGIITDKARLLSQSWGCIRVYEFSLYLRVYCCLTCFLFSGCRHSGYSGGPQT